MIYKKPLKCKVNQIKRINGNKKIEPIYEI